MSTAESLYRIFLKYPRIAIDTRKDVKDALFFALKGDRFDGNRFAEDALNKGCAFTIIDDPAAVQKDDPRFLLVDNVLDSLQKLALFHRKQLDIPVIAITGSNGKTTTKELISHILRKKYYVTATTGNLNNHIGVPLTVLSAGNQTGILVVEMGANHPGEIASLCEIALPSHGVITNIGKAHLAGFGSMENVIRAKAELYHFLRRRGGVIFYKKENTVLSSLIQPGDVTLTYGITDGAEFRFGMPEKQNRLTFEWYAPSGTKKIHTKMYGRYNFENAIAAITVGAYFGIEENDILDAVTSYIPENARSQMIETGNNRIIMDAYNANPTSMEMAVNEFLTLKDKHKVMILGDMLELGPGEEAEHNRILKILTEKCTHNEKVFFVGKIFYRLSGSTSWLHFPDTETAKEYFTSHPLKGSTILIKGSRALCLETLLPFF